MKKLDDLRNELEQLIKKYPDRDNFYAAFALKDIHLRYAEALKKSDPKLAIEHYCLAENCQGTIGTYSTGSGEGLASMMELYDIMVKRAEAEERVAEACKKVHEKLQHLEEVVNIWTTIKADPNLDELLPQKNLTSLHKKISQLRLEAELEG